MSGSEERFKLRGAVYLMLLKDDKILLLRRYQTGWQDGNYSLVSGHIDGNEAFSTAMLREAQEEAGITIDPKDLRFAQAVHRRDDQDNREYIDMFFAAGTWQGEVTNMEPEKCDELAWYPLKALPDNIVPGVKAALDSYNAGQGYVEVGW